jgi:hypothetical protein
VEQSFCSSSERPVRWKCSLKAAIESGANC